MEAKGVARQQQCLAIDRAEDTVVRPVTESGLQGMDVVDQGIDVAAVAQCAIGLIAAIEKALVPAVDVLLCGKIGRHSAAAGDDASGRNVYSAPVEVALRQGWIAVCGMIQRAVELDVMHRRPSGVDAAHKGQNLLIEQAAQFTARQRASAATFRTG